MKKIFSLLLVVCMLFATMIAVSAAGTCNISFSAAKTAVKVGETFDVTLNVELADGANFSGGNIYVSYDNKFATIEAINTGTLTASATTPANPTTGFANWTLPSRPTTSGSYMVVTFKAIAPTDAFVVGATSTTFRSSAGTITAASIGTATVKIEADEPVIEYEEVVNAVDADVTTLSDGTYTWENIAIYKATFDLKNIVAEKGYGIKAGDYSYGAAVAGTGTVDYVLAFYGIADTADLAVSEYYTVVKK